MRLFLIFFGLCACLITSATHTETVDLKEKFNVNLEVNDEISKAPRALRGFMTGRGPGVDPEGLERLEVLLRELESSGEVIIVDKKTAGEEGGLLFCLELASHVESSKLNTVFQSLKRIKYNSSTTSFSLDPLAECPR